MGIEPLAQRSGGGVGNPIRGDRGQYFWLDHGVDAAGDATAEEGAAGRPAQQPAHSGSSWPRNVAIDKTNGVIFQQEVMVIRFAYPIVVGGAARRAKRDHAADVVFVHQRLIIGQVHGDVRSLAVSHQTDGGSFGNAILDEGFYIQLVGGRNASAGAEIGGPVVGAHFRVVVGVGAGDADDVVMLSDLDDGHRGIVARRPRLAIL